MGRPVVGTWRARVLAAHPPCLTALFRGLAGPLHSAAQRRKGSVSWAGPGAAAQLENPSSRKPPRHPRLISLPTAVCVHLDLSGGTSCLCFRLSFSRTWLIAPRGLNASFSDQTLMSLAPTTVNCDRAGAEGIEVTTTD